MAPPCSPRAPTPAALYARGSTLWRCLTAAVQVGIGAASLDIGVEYVKTRHQFGVPIGSFQAVQHRLADVAVAVDGARLLAYEAAGAPRQPATSGQSSSR